MKWQTASSLRSWVRFYMIVKIKAATSELDLSAAGYYNYFTLFDTKKRIEKELKGRKTTTSCCHGCLLAIAVDYSSHRACKRGHIIFFSNSGVLVQCAAKELLISQSSGVTNCGRKGDTNWHFFKGQRLQKRESICGRESFVMLFYFKRVHRRAISLKVF